MTKSKNKKSWLEKLNEADAKQEARLKKDHSSAAARRTKSNQELDDQSPKPPKKILVGLSLVFPFLAWIIAATYNPSGWASKDPSVILWTFMIVCGTYWFIVLPLLAIFIILVTANKIYESVLIVFVASFIVSILIYTTTVNANESEFTG